MGADVSDTIRGGITGIENGIPGAWQIGPLLRSSPLQPHQLLTVIAAFLVLFCWAFFKTFFFFWGGGGGEAGG